MKILISPNELNSAFKRLINTYKEYLWTIAWADFDFELSSLLKKNKSKIQKISVGLHFYGTNPDFLEQFYKHRGVRFIEQNSGTFHPKLYLFQNHKNDWELLIGSPNFTKSAFTANTEVSSLLSSTDIGANES